MPLDPVPFLLRPMRVRYVAERLRVPARLIPDLSIPALAPRLPAGQHLVALDPLDARAGDVWAEFSESVMVAVDREPSYLRWRLSRPGAGYRAVGVVEGERLLAFGVFRVTDKHGGRIGYVMELLHRRANAGAADAVLGAMLREMNAERTDAVLAWNLSHSPNQRAFSKAGFVPLPERLRPIELHFGVAPLHGREGEAAVDRRSWYLSYLDSDTV